MRYSVFVFGKRTLLKIFKFKKTRQYIELLIESNIMYSITMVVQTVIYALQSVLQEDFMANEIEV